MPGNEASQTVSVIVIFQTQLNTFKTKLKFKIQNSKVKIVFLKLFDRNEDTTKHFFILPFSFCILI